MSTRSLSLPEVVGELSAVLEAAFEIFLKLMVTRRRGQGSKVHQRDVDTSLAILGDIICGSEGVDGDLAWHLAMVNLQSRREALELGVLTLDPEAGPLLEQERDWFWTLFLATLATSRVGREWGGLGARDRTRWS